MIILQKRENSLLKESFKSDTAIQRNNRLFLKYYPMQLYYNSPKGKEDSRISKCRSFFFNNPSVFIFRQPSFCRSINMVNNTSAYSRDFQPFIGRESLLIVLHNSPWAGPCHEALQRVQGRTVGDMRAMTVIYQLKDQTPTKVCYRVTKTKYKKIK